MQTNMKKCKNMKILKRDNIKKKNRVNILVKLEKC